MKTEEISSHQQLLDRLVADVMNTDKKKVVLFAGHFPVVYEQGRAVEDIRKFGLFSTYSLAVACQLAQVARAIHKEPKFVFFADDHSYIGDSHMNSHQIKAARNRLYKSRSGEDALLLQEYRKFLLPMHFSEHDVIRHDHGKAGRKDCLYFSEIVLRNSQLPIENHCAREYTAFVNDPKYFDKTNSYLVSFVPQKCFGHICDIALDQEITGLNASHVFMETAQGIDNIFSVGRGVTYRKEG